MTIFHVDVNFPKGNPSVFQLIHDQFLGKIEDHYPLLRTAKGKDGQETPQFQRKKPPGCRDRCVDVCRAEMGYTCF